jgi:hypothetical protein
MTCGDTFSVINLDFSIIDEVLLTKFIFQSSKFDVSTLNTQWSSLHASDFKEMAKIVTKQQHVWISVEEKFCGNQQ